MNECLGEALVGFEGALERFRGALSEDASLSEEVFAEAGEWTNLLAYKLVPHFAGEGCLIAAVTGGTNTGKSTVFNLLLHQELSPVLCTAAATRRSLIAANAMRCEQCLAAKLVPEFDPRPLEDPGALVAHGSPDNALFVAEAAGLPDHLVLLDTPDVDSIDKQNWTVAENLRAAGDVLVAVLTGEKYKDDRVVAFFREAKASGRVVVPLMNKADPSDDFAVARRQLAEFCEETGASEPCFVMAHDFTVGNDYTRSIASLDGTLELRTYLEGLDVPAIKRRVLRATVERFSERAGEFLDHAGSVGEILASVAGEYRGRAERYASKYDPAPGAEVGGLFHEFVQARRGIVRRAIGTASSTIMHGAEILGKRVAGAFMRRATLESKPEETDAEIRTAHQQMIAIIARDLATSYIESCRNLREPAAHLLNDGLAQVDVDPAVNAVVVQTLGSESISEEFRQHANRTLDTWWKDHKGKRRVLEGLDTLLAIMPAAIAAPISMYTGGVGVPEAVVLAGPLVEQFVARVIEYQFGDAMFDFLSPWRTEQQENLHRALHDHLTNPCLARLTHLLDAFEGEPMDDLKRWREACLKAL